LNKKTVLESQKSVILAQIKSMPKEQQEYIDFYNDVQTSQVLFEELKNRRLGFSIMEASTISDIRVVDKAYLETLVSPQPISIIFATLAALLFSCIVAVIRGINFLPLSNPAELFDNNFLQPMIGVVPFIDEIDNNKDDKKLISSIESMIVNIQSIQADDYSKKVILLTSPSPANGKSTISSNLANSLASIGKKVLLIDTDFKRGVMAKRFNLKSISEKTFLKINNDNLSDIKIKNNLYVIPRVRNLTNSFQFVLSKPFANQLEFFKAEFDYVILDTAPILSVADSSVLLNSGEMNFLVVRHGETKISEIKQSNDIFNQLNSQISGFIYNAYAKPQGYYGYYGNYSYQYYSEKYLYESYDYKDEV
jgi:tyrosine-protein kinase Etk/Wzc